MAVTRIALIGLDHWYSAIPLAQAVTARSDVELVAVVDDDLDKAREVAGRFGVDRASTDYRDVLADPAVDAVFSFPSTDRNPEVVIAAAGAGKHVMSTKPLARTLEEATRIVDAVRSAGIVYLPGESRARAAAFYQQLRRWIAEDRFGPISSISFSLWAGLPAGWETATNPGWFGDPHRTVGGGWADHSIYHIDALRTALRAEVESITGVQANLKHRDLAVEDFGHAILRFGNGTLVTIEDTWTAPAGTYRSTIDLVGRDGALSFDSMHGRLCTFGDEAPFEGWVQVSPPPMYADGVEQFVASIEKKAEPIATVEDAWNNLAALLAFYEAASTGTPVEPARLADWTRA
jgi:predicted dehydrogenase